LPSYGTNKFIVVIRDDATGYTEFSSVENRQPATLAETLITPWIAKLSLPRTLVTGLSINDNQELCDHVNNRLGLETNHLIMDTLENNRMPDRIMDQLHSLVNEAKLSWEDFIPVLSFVQNTSYDSCLHAIPFKLLHGYDPATPSIWPTTTAIPK
jgi:hypothetical protein